MTRILVEKVRRPYRFQVYQYHIHIKYIISLFHIASNDSNKLHKVFGMCLCFFWHVGCGSKAVIRETLQQSYYASKLPDQAVERLRLHGCAPCYHTAPCTTCFFESPPCQSRHLLAGGGAACAAAVDSGMGVL